jgi:hypothetical protein
MGFLNRQPDTFKAKYSVTFGQGEGIKMQDLMSKVAAYTGAVTPYGYQIKCMDVATSITMQGLNTESVPLYKCIQLEYADQANLGQLATTPNEFAVLSSLCKNIGAVSGILTIESDDGEPIPLYKVLLVANSESQYTTPAVYIQQLQIETTFVSDIFTAVCKTHAALGPSVTLQEYEMYGTAAVIEDITKRLDNKLREEKIELRRWQTIPLLYNQLHNSGDLARLSKLRKQFGAATI